MPSIHDGANVAWAVDVARSTALFAAAQLDSKLDPERPRSSHYSWLLREYHDQRDEEGATGMAAYAMAMKPPSGETLFRWAEERGYIGDMGAWSKVPFQRQICFDLFALVAWTVGNRLLQQQAIEAALARKSPAPGLKREDSIFAEDGDTMGTLRPEAVEAARVLASLPRAPAEAARDHAEELPPAEEAEERNVLSIGEAPARQPINKGGRGHTKKRD